MNRKRRKRSSRSRFNVGRVLVLNSPPASAARLPPAVAAAAVALDDGAVAFCFGGASV